MSVERLVPAVLVLSAVACSMAHDELAFLGTLQLAHVVFRHGARSPVVSYPSDTLTEDQWGVKWGQLSQLGEEQQLELGAYLRRRYANFLPAKHSSEDVLVRSCDVDRALVSSAILARGLYPPPPDRQLSAVYWQSVPVHAVPEEGDQLLPVFASSCPAFQLEVERVNRSLEYQCFKNRTSYLEEFSTRASGATAMVLHDSLKSKAYHGEKLPFWSRGVFPQPLSQYNDWNVFFGVACTAPLRRMFVGRLVHEILEHTQLKAERALRPDRKLFLYGAHDTNLLALLSVLRAWNGELPPFSACLMVELRLNQRQEHVVTVSYKNDTARPPHVLKLPGCRSIACSIQEFAAVASPEAFDESECEDRPDPQLPLVFHLPARHLRDEWKQCFDVK
ncbi:prostatic acid phosphatase-like [Bacillus rossius redtenbacheri]|uniref:prostatic acid phosphatase-like n=1 Tax=Bacillus rossius redtenbacheri TaxID=93214 RepID=UPI002FDD5F84